MNGVTTTMTETQPAKFSRYRSVRRAVTVSDEQTSPPLPITANTITRAPSRYRRPTQSSPSDAPPLPALSESHHSQSPPHSAVTGSPKLQTDANPSPPARRYRNQRSRRDDVPVEPPALQRPPTASRDPIRPSTATRPATAQSRTYDEAREEARMILEGEYDRLQKLKESQKQNERKLRAAQEAQAAELLRQKQAEEIQKRKERKLQELKAAQEAHAAEQQRKKQIEEEEALKAADASARHKVNNFVDAPKAQVVRMPTRKEKRFITAPQNMIRQQTIKATSPETRATQPLPKVNTTYDAPVSAVNAGERRVEVRQNGANYGINLPVTPTTTAKDLLNSASVVMSEHVDPRTAILVESFSQCGVERPLRRYEHIRDILNSWDSDAQNYLTIMSQDDCMANSLDKKDAPTSQPGDVELQMMHSCKLGKWEKRWVILRADGQVSISKRQSDGAGTNICHLSDFDVYTPTKRQLKIIKTPKKMCIAIKSQQKAGMFLDSTNFVHFFATGDKQVADRWYTSVQSWRSWYLATVMGEKAPQAQIQSKEISAALDVRPGTSASQESVPYQLGSFQPLLDFNIGDLSFGDNASSNKGPYGHAAKPSYQSFEFKSSVHQRQGSEASNINQRRGSRYQRRPPNSFPTKLLDEARNKTDLGLDSDEHAFTGAGLLARSASKKSQTSGTRYSSDEQAFTGGGLLARSTSRRVPGANTSQGKTLIDLAENSEFTEGSLLKQLQAWAPSTNDNEPKIDRNKYIEADVKVGEGY